MKRTNSTVWRGDTWLGALAVLAALALIVRAGSSWVTVAVIAAAAGYICVLRMSAVGSRPRLLAGYALACAGYGGSAFVVDALRMPVRSEMFLALDRMLFGETPAVALSSFHAPWMGEFLSAGYLSYLVYLHVALLSAWFGANKARAQWMHEVWGAFAVGLAGYLLWPASSPNLAFPELFSQPIAGGFITRTNEALNAAAAARYDAFPSLHVLVTLTLLRHDWRGTRWRFWLMLGPSLVMLTSTIALRLHYAVDLLAALVLFAMLRMFWRSHHSDTNTR